MKDRDGNRVVGRACVVTRALDDTVTWNDLDCTVVGIDAEGQRVWLRLPSGHTEWVPASTIVNATPDSAHDCGREEPHHD